MMKRLNLFTGGIAVLVLLAGAVWAGTQMFTGPAEVAADAPEGKGVKVIEIVRDEGNGPMSLRITVEPAPELLDRSPETGGVFIERDGDVISVGTGNIELDVDVEIIDDGEPERSVNLSHSGPVVEVVVGDDVVVYHDITDYDPQPSEALQGEVTVQQVVQRVGSLAEIGNNTELQVWGRWQGDSVVADVIVYRKAE
jgi:hypothetical protein